MGRDRDHNHDGGEGGIDFGIDEAIRCYERAAMMLAVTMTASCLCAFVIVLMVASPWVASPLLIACIGFAYAAVSMAISK